LGTWNVGNVDRDGSLEGFGKREELKFMSTAKTDFK
jgi:hypothetical protein